MTKRTSLLILLSLIALGHLWATEPVERLRQRLYSPKQNYVSVVAHRGDWRNSPENSLRAYERCIEMGADMIEVDVRRTKDGHLVVMHDATVDRTTNGKGRVSDLTLEQIKALRLRAGHGVVTRHPVPTLEEVLLLCRGKVLINIDKGYDYFAQLHTLLQSTGTLHQVVIKGSKSHATVTQENGQVLHEVIYMPIINLNADNAPALVEEWLAAQPVAIECCIGTYTPQVKSLLEKIRQSSTKVWINSLWASLNAGHDDDLATDEGRPHEAWGWILEQGATLIQTDRPQELIQYLKKHKRRK